MADVKVSALTEQTDADDDDDVSLVVDVSTSTTKKRKDSTLRKRMIGQAPSVLEAMRGFSGWFSDLHVCADPSDALGGDNLGNIASLEVPTAANTLNATPFDLFTKALETPSLYWFEASVIAFAPAGPVHAYYKRAVKAYRSGGAAVLGTVQNIITDESNASLDCTFVVSGNNLILRVTGLAATDMGWSALVRWQKVANF